MWHASLAGRKRECHCTRQSLQLYCTPRRQIGARSQARSSEHPARTAADALYLHSVIVARHTYHCVEAATTKILGRRKKLSDGVQKTPSLVEFQNDACYTSVAALLKMVVSGALVVGGGWSGQGVARILTRGL